MNAHLMNIPTFYLRVELAEKLLVLAGHLFRTLGSGRRSLGGLLLLLRLLLRCRG